MDLCDYFDQNDMWNVFIRAYAKRIVKDAHREKVTAIPGYEKDGEGTFVNTLLFDSYAGASSIVGDRRRVEYHHKKVGTPISQRRESRELLKRTATDLRCDTLDSDPYTELFRITQNNHMGSYKYGENNRARVSACVRNLLTVQCVTIDRPVIVLSESGITNWTADDFAKAVRESREEITVLSENILNV